VEEPVKISFELRSTAREELTERVKKQASTRPILLDGHLRSIHFLRGIHSRAQYALVAFYMLLGSDTQATKRCSVPGHPGQVFQSYLHQSALATLSLACRKAFDQSRKGMTGANFGRATDTVLEQHAAYWVKNSGESAENCLLALKFLRRFFLACSKSSGDLFKENGALGRRIGLVKQYADRSAAHISLDDYRIDLLDFAHVVAALGLVGEIVRSFDSGGPASEFNDIDESAWQAAKTLFPETPDIRLFGTMQVSQQAKCCWAWGEDEGMHMLTEQLPFAISWF